MVHSMLHIRAEQLHFLARESLAERLAAHAHRCAPEVCTSITPSQLREVAQHCISRCDHHGLIRDYDSLRFLNLMLVFGVSFDQELPWAAQALAYHNPAARMELLMDRALQQQRPALEDVDEGMDEVEDLDEGDEE